VAAFDVDVLRPQIFDQHWRRLAIRPNHEALLLQIAGGMGAGIGEAVHGVNHDLKVLGDSGQAIKPSHSSRDLRRPKLASPRLDSSAPPRCCRDKAELEAFEQFPELDHMRPSRETVDGMRQRKPERADLAALDGRGERSRADGAVVALLEQRQACAAEIGQLRLRALAAEQVAAKLTFKLADGRG